MNKVKQDLAVSLKILLFTVFSVIFVCVVPCFSTDTGPRITKPMLLERPELGDVPAALEKSRARGMVLIKAKISITGKVEEIEIIKSSQLNSLDEFLTSWVRTWEYLPRQVNGEAEEGFTVVSIQYDLVEQSFKAPQPLNEPVQLSGSMELVSPPAAVDRDGKMRPVPRNALEIKAIPVEIQNLNLKGKAKILFTVDSEGLPEFPAVSDPDLNADFAEWILDYINKTRWNFNEKMKTHQVELTLVYDTGVCSLQFLPPKYIKKQ